MCNEQEKIARIEEAKTLIVRLRVAKDMADYAMQRSRAASSAKETSAWLRAVRATEDIAVQEFQRLMALPRCSESLKSHPQP